MSDPGRMSAARALKEVRAGRLSPVRWLEACLARIEAREPEVQAWAEWRPETALAAAHRLNGSSTLLPLHGLPIGVKDVIDTVDFDTEYGSSIYRAHRPRWDAACVAMAKRAGCVVVGKTVTTEFAMRSPGPTRNPLDLSRTPGGSSSGSAAAVADFMVPIAFGTQTVGSTIRPGSYCGTVAFKPSFGLISRAGLKMLSESNDTVGIFAREVDDIQLFVEGLGVVAADNRQPKSQGAPRIGFCQTPHWNEVDPYVQVRISEAVGVLARAGASVRDFHLPPEYALLEETQEQIAEYEIAQSLAYESLCAEDQLSGVLRRRLDAGRLISRETYWAACRRAEGWRNRLDDLFQDFDLILAPSVAGEAPVGLVQTGSPVFSKIWQPLQVPSITLPVLAGPSGMPVGIQLIGNRNDDTNLLDHATWVMSRLV